MAFTQSDIDAIKSAIASGELSVRYSDGRQVQYRSMTELLKALSLMTEEVTAASGTPKTRVSFIQHSKG